MDINVVYLNKVGMTRRSSHKVVSVVDSELSCVYDFGLLRMFSLKFSYF